MFFILLISFLFLNGTCAFADDLPKDLKKLRSDFDQACQNLLSGNNEKSAKALSSTIKQLEEDHEKAVGRARKIMSTTVREMKRFERGIDNRNLNSRTSRLEQLYFDAETALKAHVKKMDPTAQIPDGLIVGNQGKCVLKE